MFAPEDPSPTYANSCDARVVRVGRIVVCGGIATYNAAGVPPGPKN
jgi:NADPH-dependent curcumin reductase CurA